jgi:hypothetical protein
MMHTSEIDMVNSVEPADIDTFIKNAAWAICKKYHKNIIRPHQAQQEHSNMTRFLMSHLYSIEIFEELLI